MSESIAITSLAPIANARKKAKMNPTITIHNNSVEYGSIMRLEGVQFYFVELSFQNSN